MNNFLDFCKGLGIENNHQILIHSSFSAIKNAFSISSDEAILQLKKLVSPESGSIIFPAFTYCFKKSDGTNEIFDRLNSHSKVGFLSEQFRKSSDVVRTSSPTHSFSLWGKITNEIGENNSPESPLGENSVCQYLVSHPESHILMLNTDFSTFTLGHYYEIICKVPWYNFSPWKYLNVEDYGVSTEGIQKLKEIPGCAKSFVSVEKHLLNKKLIDKILYNSFYAYYINVKTIHEELIDFFCNNYLSLLCMKGTCKACDSRRFLLKEEGKHEKLSDNF
jgi:aminoglycoside N3'-acetyltransferase